MGDILIDMDIILASVKLRLSQKQRLTLTLLFCMEDITDILDMLDTMDILMLMDTMDIMESVRLSQKQRLKLTLLFCMEDIMDIILDMPGIMDIPILTDFMESVMLRPSLKLTLLFSMVDTMDTT